MARTVELGFQLHSAQQEVHDSPAPRKVVVAGRGWGKTRYAAIDAVTKGLESTNWAGVPLTTESEVMYMAPTFDQAKGIFWPVLKEVAEPVTLAAHENTCLLTLVNGVRIRLKGMDNPDRARGFILRHAILDEYADMDPQAWDVITGPSVMKTNGTVLSLEHRNGVGRTLERSSRRPWRPRLILGGASPSGLGSSLLPARIPGSIPTLSRPYPPT